MFFVKKEGHIRVFYLSLQRRLGWRILRAITTWDSPAASLTRQSTTKALFRMFWYGEIYQVLHVFIQQKQNIQSKWLEIVNYNRSLRTKFFNLHPLKRKIIIFFEFFLLIKVIVYKAIELYELSSKQNVVFLFILSAHIIHICSFPL